jgi:hypothetical protein
VFDDEARTKNQRGAYVHAQCRGAGGGGAEGEEEEALRVSPRQQKGICDVCRLKNQSTNHIACLRSRPKGDEASNFFFRFLLFSFCLLCVQSAGV